MQTWDYIIVGAGSAGCVLANRLSADPNCRVLLLEAGRKDNHLFFQMPAGVAKLVGGKLGNWQLETEPQANLNNRRLYWPRGKVLGGSSSINAMIYTRGHPKDYDDWAALGLNEWAYDRLLPIFKRSENNPSQQSEFHGSNGPLIVSNAPHSSRLFDAFIEAGEQAGFERHDDFNDDQQEGIGYYQLTIKGKKRCSSAAAHLHPVIKRSNLTVLTAAATSKILFEGKRAIGVEYRRGRRDYQALASREVILSAGAVHSPHLLLLSGIGNGAELQRHGIETIHHLPGVGQNLQDHLDCTLIKLCNQPISLHPQTQMHNMILTGLKYLSTGTGYGLTNGVEAGGFVRSPMAGERPDIQLHMVGAALIDHGRGASPGHAFTIHACQLRPESRGSISLNSPDSHISPKIQPNYLQIEFDRHVMREAAKITMKIADQPALRSLTSSDFQPREALTSDEQLDAWIASNAETIYHPVGTAKMGLASDPMAVTDQQGRVYGTSGLRVVDASLMPLLIGGNTNAPTIMMAEKICDAILDKAA